MMTPKMKEDFCTQILGASRQLFLSGRVSEICREKGSQPIRPLRGTAITA